MKFCFFLQRHFASVGDAIAITLRDRYGVKEFCGYVQTRWALGYLRHRSNVQWGELLLDEEVHASSRNENLDLDYLRKLEKDIGIPNLWPYFTPDRVLMSGQLVREYPHDAPMKNHEELLRIIQVTAKRITAFLDQEKPDAVVFSVIGSVGVMLLYHLAKKRGIKTFLMVPILVNDHFVLTSRHDYFSPKEELGKAYSRPPSLEAQVKAREFIASFRDTPRPYYHLFTPDKHPISRRLQLRSLYPHRIARIASAIARATWKYYSIGIKDDYSSVRPQHYLIDGVLRKIRNLYGVADLYDEFVEGEPFAFFPLQYEPEVTLLTQAPLMTDQVWVARRIARALPVGWKLYVKEHPQMVEFRPRRFYHELKKNPNVKLVNPAIKSFTLIEKSCLVTTITGTAGFEACLMKKPLITLGNNFFDDLSFVKHCAHIDELPQLVKEQVENFKHDEAELVYFIARLIDESVRVKLQDAWFFESDPQKKITAVAPIADLLAKKMNISHI